MVAALKEHRVDGAVMLEPFISAAGSDIRAVAPVDDYVSAKRFLATGWIASESWLKTHAEVRKSSPR